MKYSMLLAVCAQRPCNNSFRKMRFTVFLVFISQLLLNSSGCIYTYLPNNLGYALLMTANKPETALYRAPTFSLLLMSHGEISLCIYAGA